MDELERAVSAASSKADRWANVSAVEQAGENADTPAQARAKWTKIYALFDATGESAQDEVFAAVNMYFLKNGASPRGKYSKDITTAGGMARSAGEVVKITGRLEGDIRQFLRGRLEDSVSFLRNNAAVRNSEALATSAENAGVSREYCWLLADWLGADCPYFVGQESSIYIALRSSKIAVAYAKRDAEVPAEDRVRAAAPETKMAHPPQTSYNRDLFG